ncbi:MAG: YfiR family protein [Flavobacteriales bacterium]|nr:YfiR family protein [Flavobacteriales bacterium]
MRGSFGQFGKWKRFAVLLVAPLLWCAAPQREADKDTNAIVQASYIYNIAKLVEWSDPSMRNGTFIIGVIGGSNLYQELIKKYSTKTIGMQPIEVRKLPHSAVIDRCNILFVGKGELDLMQEIYKNMAGKNTLIATEYPGALEDGATVNFLSVENTRLYEMSLVNARKAKLEIGSTLKQLAHRVVE